MFCNYQELNSVACFRDTHFSGPWFGKDVRSHADPKRGPGRGTNSLGIQTFSIYLSARRTWTKIILQQPVAQNFPKLYVVNHKLESSL